MEPAAESDLHTQYTNALPYLTVLPINEQRLDLSILDRVQPQLAQRLLERLLHPAQDVSIHIPLAIQNNTQPDQISQLKALQRTFERFAQQSTTWSIGFPLLFWKDAELGRHISAPLFLWQVTLKPALGDGGDWIIQPSDNNQGYLNPILKSYLETRLDFHWNETLGLVDNVDVAVVAQITEQLAERLPTPPLQELTVLPCPPIEQAPKAAWQGGLVLGQFEPLTAKDNRKLPKNLQAKHRQSWVTKLPGLPCNAAQEQWLDLVFNGHHTVVDSAQHTGKTHAVAAALPSLLADQGSALIVLPNAANLRHFQARLEDMGLGKLGILTLQDPVLDKERLINYLEKLPRHSRQIPAFDNATYSEQVHQYRHLRHQLIDAHEALKQPLLTHKEWLSLVGTALQAHDQYHRQLLGRFLHPDNFEFSDEEYQRLQKELAEHYPFFAPLDALKHPLNALHGQFFTDDTALRTTVNTLPPLVHQFRHKIQRLYERYLVFIGEHAEYVQLQYRNWVARLEQQIDKIEGDLLLYNRIYGEDFDRQSSFQDAKLKVLSLFSGRYQAIRAAKAQLLRDYQRLREDYQEPGYLSAPFPDIKEEPHLADVALQLEQVRQQLHGWQAGTNERVVNQSNALEANSSLPAPFDQQLAQLEANWNQLLEQLNQAEILRTTIRTPETLLRERTTALLKLIRQLQKLENHWDDLVAYYHWRHSWRHLSRCAQLVVQGLVKAGIKKWSTAFESWYLHQRLLKHYQPALPVRTETQGLPYAQLLAILQQLQTPLRIKAERVVKERQAEQIKRIKREKDLSLNKVRRIFKNKQLKDILDWVGQEHLGSLFPIILTTSELAPYLLPAKVALVDWVVLDQAHALPQELGVQLLQLGNQHLVLGTTEAAMVTPNALAWMLEQQGRQQVAFNQSFARPNTVIVDPTATPEEASTEPIDLAPLPPTPFHTWLQHHLTPYIDPECIQLLPRIEKDLVVDLVITSHQPTIRPKAIWMDGGLMHRAAYDFKQAVAATQRLEALGYEVLYEWSLEWWQQPEIALERLVAPLMGAPEKEALISPLKEGE